MMYLTHRLYKPYTLIKVDLDGVIRNWNASLIRVVEKTYPDIHVVYPFAEFDIQPSFPSWFDNKQFYLKEEPYDIYRNAKPYDGAIKFVEALRKIFPNVWFVTTQFRHTMFPTIEWMNEYLPMNDIPVVFSADKGSIGLNAFCNTILIDDAPHNLRSEAAARGHSICFGQSYNFNVPDHNDWYNVFGDTDFSLENEPQRIEKQYAMILDYLRQWVI